MENLVETVGLWFVGWPVIFVWIIGVMLSVTHWQKSPQKARLSLIAFVGLLLVLFIQVRFDVATLSFIKQLGIPVEIVTTILGIVGFVFSLISAGLWSLMALSIQR